MLSKERIKKTFLELVKIESPSRDEKEVSRYLKNLFSEEFSIELYEDKSNKKTGSNTGNLIGYIPGAESKEPIILSSHMDTVEPVKGIKPVFDGEFFRTDGKTVLGGDDKSGIVEIIEVLRSFKEEGYKNNPPIVVVFTTAEEIGLLGSKNIEKERLNAKRAIVLDTSGTFKVVYRAPSAVRMVFKVYGKESHAGLAPEKGINAIKVASRAIFNAPSGRIDEETTANIGVISGGKATNIVPSLVEVKAEVRSHNENTLEKITKQIVNAFEDAVLNSETVFDDGKEYRAGLEYEVKNDYPALKTDINSKLIKSAVEAGKEIGKEIQVVKGGGGSDANIFSGYGIESVVFATGMKKVHTKEEEISLTDMYETSLWLYETLKRL